MVARQKTLSGSVSELDWQDVELIYLKLLGDVWPVRPR